jgi:hypothetical protein
MGYKGNFRHALEQAEFIRNLYQSTILTLLMLLLLLSCLSLLLSPFVSSDKDVQAKPLHLIVHNIDGPMLRNDIAQTALSTLASAPGIRVLASTDHVNASLRTLLADVVICHRGLLLWCVVWDQGRRSRYNFVWVETATFAHYKAETAYTDTALLRKATVTVAGVWFPLMVLSAMAIYTRRCCSCLGCDEVTDPQRAQGLLDPP